MLGRLIASLDDPAVAPALLGVLNDAALSARLAAAVDATGEPPAESASSSAASDDAAALAAEVAVLDRATAALRSGDAAQALQWLAEHERRFAQGRLVDVRKATRVRALCQLGRPAQAHAEAAALRREHPGSAVARRTPESCDDA